MRRVSRKITSFSSFVSFDRPIKQGVRLTVFLSLPRPLVSFLYLLFENPAINYSSHQCRRRQSHCCYVWARAAPFGHDQCFGLHWWHNRRPNEYDRSGDETTCESQCCHLVKVRIRTWYGTAGHSSNEEWWDSAIWLGYCAWGDESWWCQGPPGSEPGLGECASTIEWTATCAQQIHLAVVHEGHDAEDFRLSEGRLLRRPAARGPQGLGMVRFQFQHLEPRTTVHTSTALKL